MGGPFRTFSLGAGSVVLPLLLASCAVVPAQVPSLMAGKTVRLPEGSAATLAPPQGWDLVWSDEFETGSVPDKGKWRYQTSRNQSGWYNGELQYYAANRPENARIENGRLVIEARREALSGGKVEDWGGQRYTSARMVSHEGAAWRHGFFEVRAKLPCVRGAWPAIWLLPRHQDMRWQGGEIDIAEAVGYEPDTVHHAIQTALFNHARGNQVEGNSRIDYCGQFHDYQARWTEDRLDIGVDGKVALSVRPDAFDRPMAMILNVAVGGDWGGAQGIDDAAFPARMEVEYVRVYRSRAER